MARLEKEVPQRALHRGVVGTVASAAAEPPPALPGQAGQAAERLERGVEQGLLLAALARLQAAWAAVDP